MREAVAATGFLATDDADLRGELRAGSCAMRWLRLVLNQEIRKAGIFCWGAARGFMGDAGAASGFLATDDADLRGFSGGGCCGGGSCVAQSAIPAAISPS